MSAVLSILCQRPPDFGTTLIVTSQAFLSTLGRLGEPTKAQWTVICDECFDVWFWRSISFGGQDVRDNQQALFSEAFETTPDPEGRSSYPFLSPRQGRTELVRAIAEKDGDRAGEVSERQSQLAADVLSEAVETQLIEDQDDNDRLQVASEVKARAFAGFRSVVVMAAALESHPLYAFWRAQGVHFRQHHGIGQYVTRDMAKIQGPNMRIGHVLDPGDNVSKSKALQSVSTGAKSHCGRPVPEKDRALIHAMHQAATYLPAGSEGLVSTNPSLGVEPSSPNVPANLRVIGCDLRGTNAYSEYTAMCAFSVVHPLPKQAKWLQEKLQVSADEARRLIRWHYLMQASGRLVRNPGCQKPKLVVSLGYHDAVDLWRLYPGAQWVGKIGDLPRLSATPGRTRGPQKVARLSDHPDYREIRDQLRKIQSRKQRGTAGPDLLAEEQRLKAHRAQIKEEVRNA